MKVFAFCPECDPEYRKTRRYGRVIDVPPDLTHTVIARYSCPDCSHVGVMRTASPVMGVSS